MKIDYESIYREAVKLNVSPHYLVRKKIKYRTCKKGEMDCRFCEQHREIGHGNNKKMQCEIIGINASDYFANVDKDHICTMYEKMKTKIDCEIEHNYKNYLPFVRYQRGDKNDEIKHKYGIRGS